MWNQKFMHYEITFNIFFNVKSFPLFFIPLLMHVQCLMVVNALSCFEEYLDYLAYSLASEENSPQYGQNIACFMEPRFSEPC
jgi:hypothetical protein